MQEPARKEDHRLARLTKIIHLAMPEATWKLAAAVSAD